MQDIKKAILRVSSYFFPKWTIYLHRVIYLRKWRKLNIHNKVYPIRNTSPYSVSIGNYSYGNLNVLSSTKTAKLYLGHFCSIAENVTFILNADHPLNNLTTYPMKAKFLDIPEATSKGDIIVGDDVWFGYGSIILSGVTIGRGAVVGAGAVVTKDIPPYAIVGGNPARVVKYRFPDNVIKELMKIDFSNITKNEIIENIEMFYKNVTETNVSLYLDLFREEIDGRL